MPLTDQEKLQILQENGLKPWDGQVVETPDEIQIHLTPTEGDRNPVMTGLRHLGSAIPRTATQVAGGAAALGALGGPITAVSTATGPLAPVTGFLLGAGASGGGALLANKAYDALGVGPFVDDMVGLSPAQIQRDEAEHPYITHGARFLSQIPAMRFTDPKALGRGLGKVLNPENLRRWAGALVPAEKEALGNLVGNVGMGGGSEAYRQWKAHQTDPGAEYDLGKIGLAALEGAPFGTPRWLKTAAQKEQIAQERAQQAAAATPRQPIAPAAPALDPTWQPKPAKVPEGYFTGRPPVAGDPVGPPQPYTEVPVPEAPTTVEPPGVTRLRVATPTTPNQLRTLPKPRALRTSLGEVPGAADTQSALDKANAMLAEAQSAPEAAAPEGPQQILDWLRTDKKFQPSPKASAADAPTPEPLETVEAQVRAAADPRSTKKAAFVVAGSEAPGDMAGLVPVPHRKGTLWYNPNKMTRAQAEAAVAGDQIDGTVLGMSQPEKPAAGNTVVTTDLPGAPAVQTEVVAGPEQVPAAVAAAKSAVPGGTQRLATPEEIEAGRQALRKRGFSFSETDRPIVMPNGQEAAGQFDPATGAITVSSTGARPTTHVHEGLHAELQNMMLSDNPHEVALAAEFLKAVKEETLVEKGAEAQYQQRTENPLVRLIKANWNYFRSSRLGGGDTSPERMGARLASYFGDRAPGPVRARAGEVKAQPLIDPTDQEHVPGSVVSRMAQHSPEAGAAVAANAQEKAIQRGRVFSVPEEQLSKFPRAVVQSAIDKRQREFLFREPQQYTPDELAAWAIYDKAMKESAAGATAAGYPIKVLDNYVPEPLAIEAARAFESQDPKVGGEAFIQKHLPEWHDWNQRIYGASYDPADSELYLRNYLDAASRAPNSLGSDFGALTKSAREYHLPPSLQEPDKLRAFGRYGTRWAGQVAYKKTIESNPEAAQALGYEQVTLPSGETRRHGAAGTEAAENARWAVDDVLLNQGRGTSGASHGVRDMARAVQQFANSAGIGTFSGLRNTVTKMPYHAMHAASMPEGFGALVEGTHRTVNDFQFFRDKAIELGFVTPGVDPTAAPENSAVLSRAASAVKAGANKLMIRTGKQAVETFNRAHDLAIGEAMARLALEHPQVPEYNRFLRRFAAGVDDAMPHEEQVWRVARNYAEGAQGSYGPQGLPAPMLKGGLTGTMLRIQRYGVENMLRVYQYAVKPAQQGDYKPLLVYVLGSALTLPVLQKINEAFSGRPSGLPTEEEIKAGKKSPGLERLLNLMEAAQITGAFGSAGSALGTVAHNVRGQKQQLVGDPALNFGVDVINNVMGAAEAMRRDEPVADVLADAVSKSLVDNIQVLRGLNVDKGEALDRRNKRIFEYLNERRQVTLPEVARGAIFGSLASPTKGITPTMDAARAGDQQALRRLTPEDRQRADNYPGGYEGDEAEAQYQAWLGKTQGPGALEGYRARKLAFKRRVATGQP